MISLIGIIEHTFNSVPELYLTEGAIEKIEHYDGRGGGVDIFINTENTVKRYNATRCRLSIKQLQVGDYITAYINKSFIISRVDGLIYTIKHKDIIVCNYAQHNKAKNSNKSFYWLYIIIFIIGASLSYYGYIKKQF